MSKKIIEEEMYGCKVVFVDRLIPKWAAGQSINNYIFFTKHANYKRILPHEYIHYLQWKKYGVAGFIFRYFSEMFLNLLKYRNVFQAYRNNYLEVQAYELEKLKDDVFKLTIKDI